MEVNLPVDQEFAIHAAAIAIQTLDRVELEEAFIELLHQKALDRQMFYGIRSSDVLWHYERSWNRCRHSISALN